MLGQRLQPFLGHKAVPLLQRQQCVQQAQWDLRRFSQELSDVHLPQIELNGFASFADIFFDGLWADLFVQQKINAARRQLEEASCRVEDILYQLRQMQ